MDARDQEWAENGYVDDDLLQASVGIVGNRVKYWKKLGVEKHATTMIECTQTISPRTRDKLQGECPLLIPLIVKGSLTFASASKTGI